MSVIEGYNTFCLNLLGFKKPSIPSSKLFAQGYVPFCGTSGILHYFHVSSSIVSLLLKIEYNFVGKVRIARISKYLHTGSFVASKWTYLRAFGAFVHRYPHFFHWRLMRVSLVLYVSQNQFTQKVSVPFYNTAFTSTRVIWFQKSVFIL